MNTNSLQRIAMLIHNDIQRVYKLSAIVAATGLFVLFLILYLPLSSNSPSNQGAFFSEYHLLKAHYNLFWVVLFTGGLLFTNFVLADLVPRRRRKLFLTLPASNLEKIAAKWVLTGLLFPLATLLLYWLLVLFTGWVTGRTLGLELVDMPLRDGFLWRWVLTYIGLQPIFFLGTLSLRRFGAVKTVLIAAGVGFLISAIFNISIYLLVPDPPAGISFWGWAVFDHLPVISGYSSPEISRLNAQTPWIKLPDLLMLLSPLFLLTSFLKLQEKEIT